MKLDNDFSVDAPLDETWATLLDIRRVAGCLPGATLESDGADGVFRGSMQVRLGPMKLAYQGTARMAEVEEDDHSATIEVRAKELKGQGTASARIRNRLEPGPNGATHVAVQTDLTITGRPAQFGRGIMEDVAGNMLGEFARRLENEVRSGAAPVAVGEPARRRGPAPPPAEDEAPAALDIGGAIAGPLARRAGIGLGVLALVGLVVSALRGRRRRRGLSVRVDWKR